MKVSNETKVGALTIIAITLIILGFNFLRGKTILKSGNFLYAKYADTKGLIVSNPVYINGFQVGAVFEIENTNQHLTEILVAIKLNEPYKIPMNSIATIQENPLGTNSINIVLGDTTAFFKSGDTIHTAPAASLLGDIMNTLSPLGKKTNQAITSLETVLSNLNTVLNEQNKDNFKTILANLAQTTEKLNSSIASIEVMLEKQNGSIAKSFDNVNSITKNISNNNEKITSIINNLDSTTKAIKDADLYTTIQHIKEAVGELSIAIKKINSGNGTAAKIMNDGEMYAQLNNTIKSINTLVDDIKVHPKRYINISVFGKKDKTTPLVKPLADSTTHE